MNGTGTHEWTIVHNANHRSYVEDELFKKYHFNPPPRPFGNTKKYRQQKWINLYTSGTELHHLGKFSRRSARDV